MLTPCVPHAGRRSIYPAQLGLTAKLGLSSLSIRIHSFVLLSGHTWPPLLLLLPFSRCLSIQGTGSPPARGPLYRGSRHRAGDQVAHPTRAATTALLLEREAGPVPHRTRQPWSALSLLESYRPLVTGRAWWSGRLRLSPRALRPPRLPPCPQPRPCGCGPPPWPRDA